MNNVKFADFHIFDFSVDIKYTYELAAAFFKIKVHCNGTTQVACAYEDCFKLFVNADDAGDFAAQLGNVIAVALLSEAAEAVQILSYLRGGKLHSLRKLAGGNFCDSLAQKLA